MSKHWLALGALLLVTLACNFPQTTPTPMTSDLQATVSALAATATAQTQKSGQTSAGVTTSQPSPQPLPSATATLTPTAAFTPTATPTQGPPMLSVSVDTRCRVGPGEPFDQVGAVLVGDEVEVLGRWENFWLVRLENGTVCWVWGQYATVTGDLSALPTVTPPPTPPPTGIIQGIVFTDMNHNGRYDPGTEDIPKPNVRVILLAATGGQCDNIELETTFTDSQGRFSFTVTPATYCVYAELSGMPVCHSEDVVTVRRGQTVNLAFYLVGGCSMYDPEHPCICP